MNTVDRYVLFGHPVAHTRSPQIHALFSRQCRQALSYEAVDVMPDQFVDHARQFFADGGRGANITFPHKQAALALTTQLTPRAKLAGSINTLATLSSGGLLGDNTDGVGLVRDLVGHMGLELRGRRVLLLGAGGAARGVIAPLLELHPAALLLTNRTVPRLEQVLSVFDPLADSLGVSLGVGTDGPYDLIINATSASHAGELPPMPAHAVHAGTVCYDMVYGHEGTAFTRWAQAAGAGRAEMGLGMLVEQAAEAFHLWRGVFPETAPVLAEISA
jgi:shikimate dehydrogenase